MSKVSRLISDIVDRGYLRVVLRMLEVIVLYSLLGWFLTYELWMHIYE